MAKPKPIRQKIKKIKNNLTKIANDKKDLQEKIRIKKQMQKNKSRVIST